jgi:hypothetical protein
MLETMHLSRPVPRLGHGGLSLVAGLVLWLLAIVRRRYAHQPELQCQRSRDRARFVSSRVCSPIELGALPRRPPRKAVAIRSHCVSMRLAVEGHDPRSPG